MVDEGYPDIAYPFLMRLVAGVQGIAMRLPCIEQTVVTYRPQKRLTRGDPGDVTLVATEGLQRWERLPAAIEAMDTCIRATRKPMTVVCGQA